VRSLVLKSPLTSRLPACRPAVALADARLQFARLLPSIPAAVAHRVPQKFHVRAGYEIELVAAEPCWNPSRNRLDAAGRLWVVEMVDYPLGLDGKGKPADASAYWRAPMAMPL